MTKHLIITFSQLLHSHKSVTAPEVQRFLEKHAEDKVFIRRAMKLAELFELRKQLAPISDD
ncbi:MAG: hypothetical protein O7G85_08495 [Planctomycetota bacterium]|nr:hypothetical protein [Planctomycetota bacterium]